MPSVYEIITEKIIKQLESGVAPWRKPWTCQTPANLVTQKEYRGLNVFTLASQGVPSRFWLTFNQQRNWAGEFARGRNLLSSSSGTWAQNERRLRKTVRRRPRGPFYSAITVCSICRRRKGSTSPHPFCRRPAPTTHHKCEQIVANMRARQASSNLTRRGTRQTTTWSVCQHAASFTHLKNITPLNFTNSPTARTPKALAPGKLRQAGFLWFGILLKGGTHRGDDRRHAPRNCGNRTKHS